MPTPSSDFHSPTTSLRGVVNVDTTAPVSAGNHTAAGGEKTPFIVIALATAVTALVLLVLAACTRRTLRCKRNGIKEERSNAAARPESVDAMTLADVVLESAVQLAQQSSIPGVSDAATLISGVVRLILDHQDGVEESKQRLRWCNSVVTILKRAEEVVSQVGLLSGRPLFPWSAHARLNSMNRVLRGYSPSQLTRFVRVVRPQTGWSRILYLPMLGAKRRPPCCSVEIESVIQYLRGGTLGHEVVWSMRLTQPRVLFLLTKHTLLTSSDISVVIWQGGEETNEAGRVLLDEVKHAVDTLLQVIQTYSSKNKIAQVLTSSMFKKRQEEAEHVINAAISRLQVIVGKKCPLDTSEASHCGNLIPTFFCVCSCGGKHPLKAHVGKKRHVSGVCFFGRKSRSMWPFICCKILTHHYMCI